MNAKEVKSVSLERDTSAMNGWLMLFINLTMLLGAFVWFISIIVHAGRTNIPGALWWMIPAALLELTAFISLWGHFTLQPNEARVLILFGAYKGTVRKSGFWWAHPFYSRIRARIPLSPANASH